MEAIYLLEQYFKEKGFDVKKEENCSGDQLTINIGNKLFMVCYGNTDTQIEILEIPETTKIITKISADGKTETKCAKTYITQSFELSDPNSIQDILAFIEDPTTCASSRES